jgi:hypothetical protein
MQYLYFLIILVIKAIAKKEIAISLILLITLFALLTIRVASFLIIIVFVYSKEININWSIFNIFDCANSRILSIDIKNKSKDTSFTYINKTIFTKQ